jgi:hypothetical protein
MSILDAAVMVGLETTYGTPVTLARAYEGKADAFEREQSRLESIGFRAGTQGLRSDRVITVNMGGAASIELDWMTNGMGLLLGGLLGSKAGPSLLDTTAYSQVYATTAAAPADSLTMQILRPTLETGTEEFTYHGAKATGWKISQSVDGLLLLNIDYDFEDSDHTTAAGTPTYIANQTPFDWTQCTVTLDPDGTPEVLDVIDATFEADLMLKTDRRYLRGSALKKEPVRNGIPRYTGEISVDFEDTTRYDEWVAQGVKDIELQWTGANIESTYDYSVTLRMKACNWTGGNPKAEVEATPVQTLPFEALYNGTDAIATLTTQSTDSAV